MYQGKFQGNRKKGAAAPADFPVRKPAETPVKKKQKHRRRRKGPSVGGVIFYTLYFLSLIAFCGGTWLALQWLHGWLLNYEAAQPTVKSQEIYTELFSQPDWGRLYDLAGIPDTPYEGRAEFAAYMEQKAAGKELSFVETSAGLSGDKKYIVRLDGEKIATFTMEGDAQSVTDIPDWKLGKVELFFSRQEGTRVRLADGHTAYVNGVPLGEEATAEITAPLGVKYINAETVEQKILVQTVDGLLVQPRISVRDAEGTESDLHYDEEQNLYYEDISDVTVPQEAKEAALGAARAYAEYMINASGSGRAVDKYFETGSQTYKDILAMHGELWMNEDRGHSFTTQEVTHCSRYAEDLVAARVNVVMDVVIRDGSHRDYTVDSAMFLKQKNGNWIVCEMTNEDVFQIEHKVKLTFMDGNTELASGFWNDDARELTAPVIAVPEGKSFTGWVEKSLDENGNTRLSLAFTPDENGRITLPEGNVLAPMTLYPLFE